GQRAAALLHLAATVAPLRPVALAALGLEDLHAPVVLAVRIAAPRARGHVVVPQPPVGRARDYAVGAALGELAQPRDRVAADHPGQPVAHDVLSSISPSSSWPCGTTHTSPPSVLASPIRLAASVTSIRSAIARAAGTGTAFPIRSRHRDCERPASTRGAPAQSAGIPWRAASSSVVSGRCQVPSAETMIGRNGGGRSARSDAARSASSSGGGSSGTSRGSATA